MKSKIKTKAWLPDCSWNATGAAIHDQEYFDFDAQSEQLAIHDQDYMQLTRGRFYGRFVSCFLGSKVSFHIEHANQALSQTVAGAKDSYAIGVVLSADAPFRANGIDIGENDIFIVPPSVDFHLFSPQNGTILACVIDAETFYAKLASAPGLQDWVCGHGDDIACLKAPIVSERTRQDAFNALTGCRSGMIKGENTAFLGDAFINSFFASLTLGWGVSVHPLQPDPSSTFDRFLDIQGRLALANDAVSLLNDLSRDLAISHRTLQYACAKEISLGVAGFVRHAQLHAVRRKLMHLAETNVTIGDIAAEHGFWNWSHFSQQYRQLFGERPSDTGKSRPL